MTVSSIKKGFWSEIGVKVEVDLLRIGISGDIRNTFLTVIPVQRLIFRQRKQVAEVCWTTQKTSRILKNADGVFPSVRSMVHCMI